MYPFGCPSYQKAQVKLLKQSVNKNGDKTWQLIDSTYFSNKEGFGFMLKKLLPGSYQLHFRKYSFGSDVFDFTARIYAKPHIKLIDLEQEEIAKQKKALEKQKNPVGVSRTITESSNPSSKAPVKKRFAKAGDQDTNEKRMIDVDPHTQIDMEMHKQDNNKELLLEEIKQAEKGSSNGLIEVVRGPLASKLAKAQRLAADPKAEKFFEMHKREFYYFKDAVDKKHGFYFLRLGSNSDAFDLTLKLKIFVKGDLLETTEKSEKLYVYKYPDDKFPGDYKLTTFCNIRPLKGKKTCDFLVPTEYHDRTYVYIQKKVPATKR